MRRACVRQSVTHYEVVEVESSYKVEAAWGGRRESGLAPYYQFILPKYRVYGIEFISIHEL